MGRIVFLANNRIGDAVLNTATLEVVRRRYPDAALTIVASPLSANLFRGVAGLERLIVWRKGRYHSHWLGLWRDLVGTQWDLVVDMRRSGLGWFLPRKALARSVAARPGEHKVWEGLRAIGEERLTYPCLHLDAAAERHAAALTRGLGPFLVLGPTASRRAKEWRADRFADMAGHLTGDGGVLAGASVVLCGEHPQPETMTALEAVMPAERLYDLSGKADLLGVAAVFSRAKLFVGVDSGLMHMAAAAGCATLGLFGPTDERSYAPLGPQAKPVRGSRPAEAVRAADPDLSGPAPLLDDLDAQTVAAAAEAMLADRAF